IPLKFFINIHTLDKDLQQRHHNQEKKRDQSQRQTPRSDVFNGNNRIKRYIVSWTFYSEITGGPIHEFND
ncbi:hypothetical protein ACWA2B_26100, partial [Paenibacillus sp. CMM36]